ncbi:Cerato-platanin-domain-containing protein [Pisolithus sp. B1]|nr:Cerato-platanin-domain-containing protein [Pisolithus sp. B1]
MKFAPILVSLSICTLHVLCQTTTQTLSYDPVYDDASESLDYVACSNGSNGLENLGYSTLGQVPNFPYVGGAYTVTGWNSPACGTCYNLTYENKSISILAVDSALEGFNSRTTSNGLLDRWTVNSVGEGECRVDARGSVALRFPVNGSVSFFCRSVARFLPRSSVHLAIQGVMLRLVRSLS